VRERMWLSRMLTVLSVITSVVILGAVPAHAEQINLTEGINPSAHSVTTHNGTVITGITFVNDKDVLRVRQQEAKLATQQTAAATPELHCDGTWHFIAPGGTNVYWKPDTFGNIYANGNRSSDYWNQEFLACWWTNSGWRLNEYAFLSNATGAVVAYYGNNGQLRADLPFSSTGAAYLVQAAFLICHFDGNWISIKSLWYGAWAYRDPGSAGVFGASGSLTGNNLFKLDPVLVELRC
jgi:hypothetical protein